MLIRLTTLARARTGAIAIVLLFFAGASLYPHAALAGPKGQLDDASKRAKEAYAEGQAAFNLGQWDKAVAAWQRGFQAKQDPVFLYNIAQAYRKMGNLEQAIFFYKNFLRNTSNAPNRDEVSGWVDQLEKQLADERQRKAEADRKKSAADELARRQATVQLQQQEDARRAEQERQAALDKKRHALNGDLGLAAGVNIFAAGLRDPKSSISAAVELTGGYTIVDKGRLRFRLGATFGFSYLADGNGKTDNLFGIMLDPTLKVDLWKQKLFFFVEVGLGAGIITGATDASSLFKSSNIGARGAFLSFEARPAVGLEYMIIPRLSVLLAPGAAITTPPKSDFATVVRVQVLAGLSVHL